MERVELSRSCDQLFLKQPRIPTPMDGGSVARGHGWPERPFRHIATSPLGRIRTLITTFEASRDIQFHYERSLVVLGLSARFERAVPDLGRSCAILGARGTSSIRSVGNRCLIQLGDERMVGTLGLAPRFSVCRTDVFAAAQAPTTRPEFGQGTEI